MRYELIQTTIDDQHFYMHGIEVDNKTDTKRVTHPGSHDAIDYIKGERTIDLTFTEPKDQPLLFELYEKCLNGNFRFNLICYGINRETGEPEPVLELYGCTLNNAKSSIKSKEEWKPTASGFALRMKRLNTQHQASDLEIKPSLTPQLKKG